MKTLTLAALAVVTLTFVATTSMAQASSVKIGQLPDYSDISVNAITYQVNADLGRARVDLVFASKGFATGINDNNSPYSEDQYLVPGLSYSNSQVIYNDGSLPSVVCAELATKKGIFGQKTYFKPTGACSISLSKESQTSDDGFNQTTTTDTAILFQTK